VKRLVSRVLATAVLVVLPPTARAASNCYDTKGFPSVGGLEPLADGFRVYLDPGSVHPVPKAATLIYSETRGWRKGEEQKSPAIASGGVQDSCAASIPRGYELTLEQARELSPELREANFEFEIEQKVTACTEKEGVAWFGLGFYSGEGTTGIGGIGRYERSTGKLEVRRPVPIRNASATSIAVFGDVVWMGTTGFHECMGLPPKVGLVAYKWSGEGGLSTYRGGRQICGFVVHDLQPVGDSLWVATDMGLTRVDKPGSDIPEFKNFVPDPASATGVREVNCRELYRELLMSLPMEPNALGESPFSWLVESLVSQNPWLARGFLREFVLEERKRASALSENLQKAQQP